MYFRRVHVSEVTLSFLNDEFEVEPAHGERREEMLRQAGIKTYFIVRVLKPVSRYLVSRYEMLCIEMINYMWQTHILYI